MSKMILSQLKPIPGSRKKRKRIGRGEASGRGGTSGKGHKGQNSRSGGGVGPGFEGGQMPLQRRIPKRGFSNIFRQEYQIINLSSLAKLKAGEVTVDSLVKAGLIKNNKQKVKLLGNGELKVALNIKVNACSKTAADKVTKAGGKVEVI